MGMQVSIWNPDFNEVGLLNHTTVLFLMFWATYIMFLKYVPFYIPSNSVQGSNFTIALACLKCYVTVFLICIPLTHLLAICISSLERCLSKFFCHFNQVEFLLLWYRAYSYILDINSLSYMAVYKYFPPLHKLLHCCTESF
jgi:hypothetical protein